MVYRVIFSNRKELFKKISVVYLELGGNILGMSSLRQNNLFGTVIGQKGEKSTTNEHVQPKPKIRYGGPYFDKKSYFTGYANYFRHF